MAPQLMARDASERDAREHLQRELQEWKAQRAAQRARDVKSATHLKCTSRPQASGKENALPVALPLAIADAAQHGRCRRDVSKAAAAAHACMGSKAPSCGAGPLSEISVNSSFGARQLAAVRNGLQPVVVEASARSSSAASMLELWEERAQEPAPPHPSPAKPWLFDSQQSSLYPCRLGAALVAALTPLTSPADVDLNGAKPRQSLFQRLEEVAVQDEVCLPEPMAPFDLESVPSAPSSLGRRFDLDSFERLRTAVERLRVQKEAGPEIRCLRQLLCEHVLAWEDGEYWCDDSSPENAKEECRDVLNTEDLLTRAFDITTFFFFERRDLIQQQLLEEGQQCLGPLLSIPEYPPDWKRWKINSFELREAAQEGRRRSLDGCRVATTRPVR